MTFALHEGEEQATSMVKLVSTLEPSMLAIFGGMAVAATAHRRFRTS